MLLSLAVLLTMVSGEALAQTDQAITPRAAANLVTAVHKAAASGNPAALRKFMAADFISSFGGDGGPDEAVALWSRDKSALEHLAQSTAGQCELQSPDYLECPPDASTGYRAGFKLTHGKWVFFAFVAGD